MRAAALLAIVPVLWAAPASSQSFTACVDGLKQAAVSAGVGRDIVNRALDIREPNDRVLRLSQVQPETRTPIWDYFAFLIDDERIADGREMMRRHESTFRAAEERFGVNRYVIAAIWGIESDYGRQAGDNFLPHALATLTCASDRRRDFWRGELMAALRLVQRGDLDLDQLYGSWAGAFGQTQFIPTSYDRLAIDFDGNGRRDLVNSVPDALGSTANYLARAGWQRGESWMIEVKVPSNYSGPTGRTNKASLATWAQRGVTRADGAAISGGARAGLLLPAGPRGPGFLVFRNFDAIFQYNHAESYALAISYLADRIAGYPGLRTAWPTDDPGLSRADRRRLQEMLARHGYYDDEIDGRIGPASRAAIRAAERHFGMEETGRAGRNILRRLGG
jgi:lytic murein transglycosylase